VTTKFIILFNGRSGATLLQRSLNRHPDVFCEDEVLGGVDSIERLTTLFATGDKKCRGLKTKLVALGEDVRTQEWLAEHEVRVLHLRRDNPVKQALSIYVAARIYARQKAFHLYKPEERITPIHVALDEYRDYLMYVLEMERRLHHWMAKWRGVVMRMSYEGLAENPADVLTLIQRWLGVPMRSDVLDPMIKVVPDNLREAVKNYDELRAFVLGAHYGRIWKGYF